MRMRMIIGCICICAFGAGAAPALWAGEAAGGAQQYLSTEDFLARAFPEGAPAPESLWPSSELRQRLADVLGHKPGLRFKYWGVPGKTAWILDEIGKDRPITAGVIIADGVIQDIRVLTFRESRGWEIKYDFFTQQFIDMWLSAEDQLSGKVDSITGATLSVKAMKRMARAALLLHEHSDHTTHTIAHAR